MLKKILIICTAFTAAYGLGQFSVLYAPDALLFKGTDKVESDDLEAIIPACLGYFIEKSSQWPGLYINDPFGIPHSAILVTVDGIDSLKYEKIKAQSYAVTGDKAYQAIDALNGHIEEQNGIVADVQLIEGLTGLQEYKEIFGDLKPVPEKSTNYLKTENKAHKQFLQQINIVNAIADSAATIKLPTFLNLRIALDNLLDDSSALAEAVKLLTASIENLTKSYQESTKGDVLVVSFASKSHPVVRIRRAAAEPTPTPKADKGINVAPEYTENYPIIFNIILWFSVVMIFTLLSISYAIAYMDPGRDSIIYRMTSIRIKKDN